MTFGAILTGFTGLFNSIFGGIDSISTTDEERLKWKTELTKYQVDLTAKVMEMEMVFLKAQSSVLKAEMQHGNWLSRSWRPLTMLSFVAFIIWFGIGTAFKIPVPDTAFIDSMMTLIKIGMGGYILGRSGEKIAVNVVGAMKKKEGI
jgi:hypothetical protein